MSIPAFGAFVQASTHTLDSDIMQTPHIIATDNIQAEFHVTVNRSLQQNYPSYSSLSSLAGGATGTAGAASSLVGTAPALQNYKALGPADQDHPPPERIGRRPPRYRRDDLRHHRRHRRCARQSPVHRTRRDDDAHGPRSEDGRHRRARGGQGLARGGEDPDPGDILCSARSSATRTTRKEKTDLVLVLTPYIIRDQEDMRRIVERRMEERHELLDHQALFSDRPWREAPFQRARGILGAMRTMEKTLDVEREREEALLPRPAKVHEPSEPIELPPSVS